jgi:hypothetical protein
MASASRTCSMSNPLRILRSLWGAKQNRRGGGVWDKREPVPRRAHSIAGPEMRVAKDELSFALDDRSAAAA